MLMRAGIGLAGSRGNVACQLMGGQWLFPLVYEAVTL